MPIKQRWLNKMGTNDCWQWTAILAERKDMMEITQSQRDIMVNAPPPKAKLVEVPVEEKLSVDLASLKRMELVAMAKQLGLDIPKDMSKDEIVKLLTATTPAKDEPVTK